MSTELLIYWGPKDDHLGWHEFILDNDHTWTAQYFQLYRDVVQWISTNIDNPPRHARWIITPENIRVKFRYERDYMMCALRWS